MAAEKNFENKVKAYLRDHDAYFVKFFANRMTKTGVPDILACINGYFVAIEVKAEHGRPSELQKHNVREVFKANGIAMILYPQDFNLFKGVVFHLLGNEPYKALNLCDLINERSL